MGLAYTMPSILKSFLIGAVFCSFSVATANADVFQVEDQDDRFSVTFPDTWDRVDNQKSDDKLTVLAQGEYEFAGCRVRVREDRRFVIYPKSYDDSIQRVEFSREFWNNYLGEYNAVVVDDFRDNAGLSVGHASMIEASYETAEGSIVRKRGLMFASLYHDQLYIVDCAAEKSVYDKWRPSFLSIVKSLEFAPVTHHHPTGNYRDFSADDPVEITGPKELDAYKL